MPKTIPIEEIEDGMELHSEASNKFGQTLIGAGTMLAEKHKKILKTWNITHVEIKSDDQEVVIELSDETIASAKEFISRLIKWEPRNKFEEEIYFIAIKSAAIALKKGGAHATA